MSLSNTPTPYIGVEKGEIAETILLPGDPLRAKYIAGHFLEDVKQSNRTRNMLGYTGIYMGKPIFAMGTGIGCPSTGIYSYELIHFYGCKNLIQMSMAGALTPDVHVRGMMFVTGVYTTNNFMHLLGLPGGYSPVCSYSLLEWAVAAVRERGLSFHVGNMPSPDMFYAPPKQVQGGMTWADMGILAVGIKAATLYANVTTAGVNTPAVLTILDSTAAGETASAVEKETSFTQMTEAALSLVSQSSGSVAYKKERTSLRDTQMYFFSE